MSGADEEPRLAALPANGWCLSHRAATPLVAIDREQAPSVIWCKLEFLNPSGSIKDRVAAFIVLKAYRKRRIGPGSHVVEASSGSTSISLALLCGQLGLRFVAVMPGGVTSERVSMIRALGGRVEFVSRIGGLAECQKRAELLAEELGAFLPRQFSNVDNANAHRFGTACEIIGQVPGGFVDAVVAGVGTGGTLVGLGRGFRDAGCSPRLCAAKPIETHRGAHACCAVGECFCDAESSSFSSRIPGVVENMSDLFRDEEAEALETVEIDDDVALQTTRKLNELGFPVGPSSGLNLAAAEEVSRRLGPSATVVTVFPDRMERYLSTDLFEEGRPEIR